MAIRCRLYFSYFSHHSSFFPGRRGSRPETPERGGEKGRALPGVQSLGLPVGKRHKAHRVRRPDRVHEKVRAEIRE